VALLNDPQFPATDQDSSDWEPEAQALGMRLSRVDAGTPAAISDALVTLAYSGAEALIIQDSAMFNAHR
jgi:hypothetical protein